LNDLLQKTGLIWVFLILSPALFIPAIARADDTEWWSSDFSFRNVYSINSSLIDADLVNFPVLVYLNSSVVEWINIQNDLDDLRFISSENELLDHEVDGYSDNDFAWIWVRIPEISNASDTVFFMYYGNVVALSVENASGVWDDSFVMVQHLSDNSTSTVLDSTSNDNDGTKKGINEPIEATGKIGKAQDEDGNDDYIVGTDIINVQKITWECWVYATSYPNNKFIVGLVNGLGSGTQEKVLYSSYGKLIFRVYDGGNKYTSIPVDTIPINQWVYLVGIQDGTNAKAYVNGVEVGTVACGDGFTGYGVPNIFIGGASATYTYLDAVFDEVRITNIARSVAWVSASYETQRLNLIELLEAESYFEPYAERGEILAAGVILALILVPLLILIIFAVRRKH